MRSGGLAIAALVLLATGCSSPAPPPAPGTAAAFHPDSSPAPRPAVLEEVPRAGERSPRLEEELRRALPAGLRVDRVASTVHSGRQHKIGALITDGRGYGVVVVSFDSPPITSGEPGCFKHQRQHCKILPQPDGDTVSMVDRAAEPEQRSIMAERFRPDRGLRLTVRSLDGADELPSWFWRGGPRLGRVPLDADQVVALSGHPGFTAD